MKTLRRVTPALFVAALLALSGCAQTGGGNCNPTVHDLDALIQGCQLELASGGMRPSEAAGAWSNIGGAYIRKGQYDLALVPLNNAVAADPTAYESYVNRGAYYRRVHQPALALADLNMALQLAPSNPTVFRARAEYYWEMNQYEPSIADFTSAIAINGSDYRARRLRAQVYMAMADLPHALADADFLVDRLPGDGPIIAFRCWLRAAGGFELDKAQADCKSALELSPANMDALGGTAIAHYRLGRTADALAGFNALVTSYPNNTIWLYLRGIAKRQSGDAAGGKADMASALAKRPDIVQHLREIGIAKL